MLTHQYIPLHLNHHHHQDNGHQHHDDAHPHLTISPPPGAGGRWHCRQPCFYCWTRLSGKTTANFQHFVDEYFIMDEISCSYMKALCVINRWTSSCPTSQCLWWRRSSRLTLSTISITVLKVTFSSWRLWRRRRIKKPGTKPTLSDGQTVWSRWNCLTRSSPYIDLKLQQPSRFYYTTVACLPISSISK